MTADWTRPEKDGWHLLRWKEKGDARVAFYRYGAGPTGGLWKVFNHRGVFWEARGSLTVAGDFDYIAPIEEPRS